MKLTRAIQVSVVIYVVGIAFYSWFNASDLVWFALGGALALTNVLFAAWVVHKGLKEVRRKAVFLGLLLMKSLSFFVLIAIILMFLKPQLLPFTLGIGIVIFASTCVAAWESRRFFVKHEPVDHI